MGTTQGAAEQRVVLHNVAWDTYEQLLRDHADSSAPRFTYDRGVLEIMSPLPIHERYKHLIDLLMPVIAEQLGKELYGLSSTTFRREDLQRGFESDACFYLEHAEDVRGKERLDLLVDPPPDLVIAIDVTHSSLDKLAIYRQLGVPEVWRFNGERLQILVAAPDRYEERPHSPTFHVVGPVALTALLQDSLALGDLAWLRRARAWVRSLIATTDR